VAETKVKVENEGKKGNGNYHAKNVQISALAGKSNAFATEHSKKIKDFDVYNKKEVEIKPTFSTEEFPELSGKKEKHFGKHSSATQQDEFVKDNVNKAIKSDQITVGATRKSYSNISAKIPEPCEKDNVKHSASTSTGKEGDDTIKKMILSDKVKYEEKEEQSKLKI
jgi:hypothetical protein